MDEPSTTDQLYALREQLQSLEIERQARHRDSSARAATVNASVSEPEAETIPPELAAWLGEDGEIDAQAALAELRAGAGRWVEGFNEDLKDTKPSTLLLIFGLGVMVGKMTA